MDKQDMLYLIGIADGLEKLDEKLKSLTGAGHGEGELQDLDNVYELLLKYSHDYYRSENTEELFFRIIEDRKKSREERADILMDGTIRYGENDNVINFPAKI